MERLCGRQDNIGLSDVGICHGGHWASKVGMWVVAMVENTGMVGKRGNRESWGAGVMESADRVRHSFFDSRFLASCSPIAAQHTPSMIDLGTCNSRLTFPRQSWQSIILLNRQ